MSFHILLSPPAADVGAAGLAAIAGGLVANPVMLFSEYTLKTTGEGIPPGPGGLYGAVEGVSYLVVRPDCWDYGQAKR
jgi:hypothetical protein